MPPKTNFEAKVQASKEGKAQLFETLYRELQRRAHPDMLRASHPVQADVNDASMQIINNLVRAAPT